MANIQAKHAFLFFYFIGDQMVKEIFTNEAAGLKYIADREAEYFKHEGRYINAESWQQHRENEKDLGI